MEEASPAFFGMIEKTTEAAQNYHINAIYCAKAFADSVAHFKEDVIQFFSLLNIDRC